MYTQPVSTNDAKPVTLATLAKMKAEGVKIASLTAYDASFAAVLDGAGVDFVLVGDSLGNVIQGHPTTVPVTLDDIVYHTKNVARGLKRAFLMADMPFLTYPTRGAALANAGRLMQEGGAKMVKLEGSGTQADIVRYLTENGVPVCAHLGLRPQFVHKLGGYPLQGKDPAAAKAMLKDAQDLEQAGADMILLEKVPTALAARITAKVKVPVIGIGAGPRVDGQILVLYDMLGITPGKPAKFVRNFMTGVDSAAKGVAAYVNAVRDGSYPAPEHSFD